MTLRRFFKSLGALAVAGPAVAMESLAAIRQARPYSYMVFLKPPATSMSRANYDWREYHSGSVITWSELKADGITVIDK